MFVALCAACAAWRLPPSIRALCGYGGPDPWTSLREPLAAKVERTVETDAALVEALWTGNASVPLALFAAAGPDLHKTQLRMILLHQRLRALLYPRVVTSSVGVVAGSDAILARITSPLDFVNLTPASPMPGQKACTLVMQTERFAWWHRPGRPQ